MCCPGRGLFASTISSRLKPPLLLQFGATILLAALATPTALFVAASPLLGGSAAPSTPFSSVTSTTPLRCRRRRSSSPPPLLGVVRTTSSYSAAVACHASPVGQRWTKGRGGAAWGSVDDDDETAKGTNKNGADANEMAQAGKKKGENGHFREGAELWFRYFRARARVGLRQMRDVAAEVSCHLPPASPPLLLLAVLPAKPRLPRGVATTAATTTTTSLGARAVVARRMARFALCASFASWAHRTYLGRSRLTPLPLPHHPRGVGSDFWRAELPPFLPEELQGMSDETYHDASSSSSGWDDEDGDEEGNEGGNEGDEGGGDGLDIMKRRMDQLYHSASGQRQGRGREAEEARRVAARTELMAWQRRRREEDKRDRKKRREGSRKGRTSPAESIAESDPRRLQLPLGYALVTGASRGIGRAIAVQLARWGIPLVLVARDSDLLKKLAKEIEQCYGVKCCVVPADLSEPGCAARLHRATSEAGLIVDLLVNNAGVCERGSVVDDEGGAAAARMVQVNAATVAELSALYGRDMRDRGRGRILFLSSMVGSVPAGPGVACYAATKAFERSLASSMGKELEPHGVGVTCAIPGAVKDTAFAASSNVEDAMCWKVPFYAKSPEMVADQSVRAMLAGDPEVCPGWQNLLFLRIATPMLPPRLTTLVVEFAWNPWESHPRQITPADKEIDTTLDETMQKTPKVAKSGFFGRSSSKVPPRNLSLPDVDVKMSDNIKDPSSNKNTGKEQACRRTILITGDGEIIKEEGEVEEVSPEETETATSEAPIDNDRSDVEIKEGDVFYDAKIDMQSDHHENTLDRLEIDQIVPVKSFTLKEETLPFP